MGTDCTADWTDDLIEALLTHYVGGAWRAPLSTDMADVPGVGARLVLAGPADFARAGAAAAAALPGWAALGPAGRADALAGVARSGAPAGAPGLALIAAAALPATALAPAVTGRLLAGAAVLLLPDPAAPLPALGLIRALHRAALPAGVVALLHGTADAAARHLDLRPHDPDRNA